jgi:hypothetical protein
MPAPMLRTETPGVYRRGSRYVATYRGVDGRQHKESAATLEEARVLKAERVRQVLAERRRRAYQRALDKRPTPRGSTSRAYSEIRRALANLQDGRQRTSGHARRKLGLAMDALYTAEDLVNEAIRLDA